MFERCLASACAVSEGTDGLVGDDDVPLVASSPTVMLTTVTDAASGGLCVPVRARRFRGVQVPDDQHGATQPERRREEGEHQHRGRAPVRPAPTGAPRASTSGALTRCWTTVAASSRHAAIPVTP